MNKQEKKQLLESLQFASINCMPPVDFHTHTNWTDGQDSEFAMYDQAVLIGLRSILFSEHVRKNSNDWFGRFADSIRNLPYSTCTAYVGAETKVLDYNGNIDCSKEIINKCDFIMASVHRFPSKSSSGVLEFDSVKKEEALELEYELSIKVLDNCDIDILGHPFGMCFKRFDIIPPIELFKTVVKKASSNGVAIEVNSSYHTHPWEIIELCRQEGALITLGSDAHCTDDIGKIVRILKGETAWNL